MKKALALTVVSASLVAAMTGVVSAEEVGSVRDYFVWQQLTGN